MTTYNKTAKMAGVLYLLVIIFGMFSELVVGLKLIVPGDASTTARNIIASEPLFRIGFISGLLHHTSFFLLVLVFYKLLRDIHREYATLMLFFGLGSVPIMMLNMVNQFGALLLLKGDNYLTVFTSDQLQALALLFLNFHSYGYFIAGLFSGLFLLPLGYLIFQSGFIPKFLGVLIIIGCGGYLLELLTMFLLPNFEMIAFLGIAAAILAEGSLTIWLLLKRIDVETTETDAYRSLQSPVQNG
jgi:hypothetical protein